MLTFVEQELLTAYVDGELAELDQRRVERLLRHKPEARELLAQLQADSRALAELPRLPVPVDLTDRVVAGLQGRSRPVRIPSPAPAQRSGSHRWSAWMSLTAAASVLLLIGLTSFLIHSVSDPDEDFLPPNRQASILHPRTPDQSKQPSLKLHGPSKEGIARQPRLANPLQWDPDFSTLPEDAPAPELMPYPMESQGPVLASGDQELPPSLERVEVDLPSILSLHTFDPATVEQLNKRFSQGGAFRVELPARDATRGLNRVKGVLSRLKWEMILHPLTQARLSHPTWKTDFGLFLENLTPTEAITLLREIGKSDRPTNDRKVEPRFEGSLILKIASLWDRRELREMLGIDPIQSRPTAGAPGAGPVDIRKPLSERTSQQVADALDGKGVPRPGARLAHSAYVAPLGLPRGRTAELKRFLDNRKPAQPGTIQLMLVLRNVGA